MVIELKINPEYEALLPKLPKEEYEALKESIRKEGQHYPIVVNKDGIILDGHHRYRICGELGIEPKFEVKDFENPLLEKKFVIESNLLRRQLTTFQRIEMGKPLLEIEKALAKQRQLTQNFAGVGLPAEGEALELFAEKVGSNKETVRQALYLMEHAPPEELTTRIPRSMPRPREISGLNS
jgi:ParB-like chromosome segregation protein Spo0J